MKTGAEDKKKVYILIGLLAVIIPVAFLEMRGMFGGSPAPPPPPPVVTQQRAATARTAAATTHAQAGPEAEKLAGSGIDPTLHLDKLAESEDVEYEGTGRNIFSADSTPVVIPQPLKTGRNDTASVTQPSGPPPPPQAPAIDLKYFGYEQSRDKSMIKAFLLHGDDIFMARPGEVIDHRYKVGTISPASVQITDMAYNNTQNVNLTN